MEIFLITPEWLNVLPKFATKCCFDLKKKTPVRSRKIPCFAKSSKPFIWKKNLSPDPCVPLPPTILNVHQLKDNKWLRDWFYHYFFFGKKLWMTTEWFLLDQERHCFYHFCFYIVKNKHFLLNPFPAEIYLFKVNKRNNKKGVKYVQRYQ